MKISVFHKLQTSSNPMSKASLYIIPLRAIAAVLLALAAIVAAPRAFAQANSNPPERMTYQGFLVDANGNALAPSSPKNYDVIFRIWNDSNASAAANRLWTEQQTVTVDKGYFSVLLGEGSAIGEARPELSTLFTNATASDRWVGLTVKGIGAGGTDVNILPRLRLLTSPYAFLARGVSGAGVVSANNLLPSIANGLWSGNGTDAFRASGNVGIGTSTPGFPLNFANSLGDKISLWGQSGNHLGFGVQAGALQIHGANSGDDIAFGYGTSAAMTETMRIKGTGRLQVSGGVLARGGAPGGSGSLNNGYAFAGNGGDNDTGMFSSADGLLQFYSDSGERMRIQPGGYVGIGSTAPAYPLTVETGPNFYGMVHKAGSVAVGTYADDLGGWLGTASAHPLHFFVNNGWPSMTVATTGKVGIGTDAPLAALDVRGISARAMTGKYFGASSSGLGTFSASVQYVSVKSEWYVEAFGYVAVSDQRIKDNLRTADSRRDLETIERLRVTDYRMKDQVVHGDKLHKGFIAQEVGEVIPEAVNKTQGFIPDIYSEADKLTLNKSTKSLTVGLKKAHGLKQGDKVRLIADEATTEREVTEVPDTMIFVVGSVKEEPKRLFVYGKQVDDFHALDYNRIFITGISAIQELKKEMDVQMRRKDEGIARLHEANQALEKRLAEAETAGKAQAVKLAGLESLVKEKLAGLPPANPRTAQLATGN